MITVAYELPAELRTLRELADAADRDRPTAETVKYGLEFAYKGGSLVTMDARSPLPIPNVGDTITVYTVPVRVTSVEVNYEWVADYDPYVLATIEVEPAG